jgi:hypothetical protein
MRYGLARAAALWLWTILVGLVVLVGLCACVLPGIYLSYATCLFGFIALFERGKNPIARSFGLTHANFGPTLGRVAIVFAIAFVYRLVVGVIFGAIGVAVAMGSLNSFTHNFVNGIVSAIATLVTAPAIAVGLVGLLPTYAELRAREGSLSSTAQLQHELGA